jgi:spectinomycin phosphotransferase
MLEKPALSDEKIIDGLRQGYGLGAANVEFLPIGNDPAAWAYKIHTGRSTYFLKIRQGKLNESGLFIPRYLRNRGIEQVMAALPTRSQALWHTVEDFALILYPFIEGSSGMDIGLTDSQWVEFGTILKNIHATPLSPELQNQVRKETFSPQWMDAVGALQAKIQAGIWNNDYEKDLGSYWQSRAAEIGQITRRAADLGDILREKAPPIVLCHADIHTANVMVNPDGRLFIIDWDDPIIAPVERDLMFIIEDKPAGKPTGTDHQTLFFSSYGDVAIDPVALAYYRYDWVVQEIGDFGARVFGTDAAGEETRLDAVRGFKQLFDPRDVVEAAYEADTDKRGKRKG